MTLQEVVRELIARNETLACAESMTGGYISYCISSVPGASKIFKGGIVAYQNEIKEKFLGVDPAVIEKHTAVSEPVAEAMARNVRERFGVDHAVAVTGYAGPGGETPGKAYLAYSGIAGTFVQCHQFHETRDNVRRHATAAMLVLLQRQLELEDEKGE